MKKTTLFLVVFILFQTLCFSQNDISKLNFDTMYYKAIDKWVVFPKAEKDSTYTFGFIYIDEMAGFTFRFKNTLKIKHQQLIPSKKDSIETTMIIYRLEPNTKKIAVLNDDQINTLKLPKKPQWLNTYKRNETSVRFLKQIGYHYNHIGASNKALAPLLKAYKIEPHFEGLEFELGFAYNATNQFEKAIPILEKAIQKNKDQLLYKELGYALMNSNQLKKAERVYTKGIKKAKDSSIKVEMAINMCSVFLNQKNRKKHDKWLKKAKKHMKENSPFKQYIDYFENEWEKQEQKTD